MEELDKAKDTRRPQRKVNFNQIKLLSVALKDVRKDYGIGSTNARGNGIVASTVTENGGETFSSHSHELKKEHHPEIIEKHGTSAISKPTVNNLDQNIKVDVNYKTEERIVSYNHKSNRNEHTNYTVSNERYKSWGTSCSSKTNRNDHVYPAGHGGRRKTCPQHESSYHSENKNKNYYDKHSNHRNGTYMNHNSHKQMKISDFEKVDIQNNHDSKKDASGIILSNDICNTQTIYLDDNIKGNVTFHEANENSEFGITEISENTTMTSSEANESSKLGIITEISSGKKSKINGSEKQLSLFAEGKQKALHTDDRLKGKEQIGQISEKFDNFQENSELNVESTAKFLNKKNFELNDNVKHMLDGDFIPPPTDPNEDSVAEYHNGLKIDENIPPKVGVGSDDVSTSEGSFCDPDPEHLEAITQYISKVVKEKSVDVSLADKVVYDMNRLFNNHFEGNVVDLYGSYKTNLAISTSDINIVMINKVKADIKKNFMKQVRNVMSDELGNYNVHPFEDADYVTEIKIQFAEPRNGIRCQLAYLGKRHSNISKLQQYLKRICIADERVRKLIIATKVWAEFCQINEVEDGKLHPIGFILMMIHFLQQYQKPVLSVPSEQFQYTFCTHLSHVQQKDFKSSDSSIGELWLGFLKYYALTFNWLQNVVTISSKETVTKKSLGWESYWIAIEDPFSHKNIAKSVINSDTAEYIKACFKSYYEYFATPPMNNSSDSTDENSSSDNDVLSKSGYSFHHCFVEQSDNFCEMCDELDDICEECQKKNYVPPLPSVPKMTETFLKTIRSTLYSVHEKYMLTEDEVEERKEFVMGLQKQVNRIPSYRNVKLELFGSSVNGFGFKKSDLDICMIFDSKVHVAFENLRKPGNDNNSEQDKEVINSASVLRDLRMILRRDKDFTHVNAIFSAKIPILKFHYIRKNWNGDISLSNNLAVHNSRLLHTYSLIDERCRILGCCLKLLAKKAIIADTADKALSSYSYLIMVIHFLQQTEPPVLPILQDNKLRGEDFKLDYMIEGCNTWFCDNLDYIKQVHPVQNETPVEQLWLDLLEYYCNFDHKLFVSIRQKEILFLREDQRTARLFNIQDPFLVGKNLGLVVSEAKAQAMQSIFRRARSLFRNPVEYLPTGVDDYENLFFSTMSLTGQVHKEVHCDLCGKFGHEQKDCNHSHFPVRRRPYRQFQFNYNYKTRFATHKQRAINQQSRGNWPQNNV